MISVFLFLAVIGTIIVGYPVAFTLAGVSLVFAGIGMLTNTFDAGLLHALPSRIYGLATNPTLVAIPLFVFMGVALQKTRIASDLLLTSADLFHSVRSGLALSVVIIGGLLAASTGIVGATVTTMGLLSLPAMMKRRYDPGLACGTICAAGTLGQIIPPSIVLILLGEAISAAYQRAQNAQGNLAPDTVSVVDLFVGALVPGIVLILLYILFLLITSKTKPELMGEVVDEVETPDVRRILSAFLAPLVLIVGVLGSIFSGAATPTEAASVGAVATLILAYLRGALDKEALSQMCLETLKVTCMVFMILIGATFFSLVFRGFGGDDFVHQILTAMPGDLIGAMLLVMLLIFVLGFVLDFIEITFIVVPIVGPTLIMLGADPIWLAIMIAINLQTSFLTPPFGFSLFYLRGVAPKEIATPDIYKGVIPFIGLQVLMLILLASEPRLATWLPSVLLD